MDAKAKMKASFKGTGKDISDPQKMFVRFFKFFAYSSLFLVQKLVKNILK
ncbi:MAG: hypothetical protein WC099_01825 [Candidatus Paceibacterota bacterium]